MTGKFGFVALLMSVAQTLLSAELAIVSGGARVVDRDPASAGGNCSGWTYGPAPVAGEDGNIIAMYTVGDRIANHCKVGIESVDRFGD